MYVDRTVDNALISLDHVMQRSFVEQEPLTFPALVLLSFIIIIFFSKMVFWIFNNFPCVKIKNPSS